MLEEWGNRVKGVAHPHLELMGVEVGESSQRCVDLYRHTDLRFKYGLEQTPVRLDNAWNSNVKAAQGLIKKWRII